MASSHQKPQPEGKNAVLSQFGLWFKNQLMTEVTYTRGHEHNHVTVVLLLSYTAK
jgi:hypothetical protein